MSGSRAYRQVARAAATEDTRRRIVDAFATALRRQWMDEITLDAVAAEAGTTRQTVIRLFGGKEPLLAAVAQKISVEVEIRRSVPDDADVTAVTVALARDYEESGDMILRLLAQEEKYPDLSALLDVGRQEHRRWVTETFRAGLAQHNPQLRAVKLDQLVAATDVYVWRLFRRDMKHAARASAERIAGLIRGILSTEKTDG